MTDQSSDKPDSIEPFYSDWRRYNGRIVDGIRGRSASDLALSAAPDQWPIWALASHIAGARLYWLCEMLGEPGADRTPFTQPQADLGWEDEPENPRAAIELVEALESTWAIVEGCLAGWTPAMLRVPFQRQVGGRIQNHTRQTVLLRLITHDAYHAGEIALTLGMHGRPILDLWPRQRPDPPGA